MIKSDDQDFASERVVKLGFQYMQSRVKRSKRNATEKNWWS